MATEAPVQDIPTTAQAPDQRVEHLFRFSGWVHVGPGADDCEAVDEGEGTCECSNPLHWHAWARLPNQIQHETIREKALAAKGRRVRQLKDPATDAHDALEGALDEMAAEGDAIKEGLVVELLDRERMADYLDATREVIEIEEPGDDPDSTEPVKPYEHITDDQAKLVELEALPEEERGDEYTELVAHLERYRDLVEQKREEIYQPKRDALMAEDLNQLIDRIRRVRIRTEANNAFMVTYSRMEWLMCTLTRPGGPRRFKSGEELDLVAPEVYEALRSTYDDLEHAQNEVVSGNS